MDELIQMIEEWSKERGINKADPQKQMLKLYEEIGETSAAVVRDDKDALRDAIGDSVITLLNCIGKFCEICRIKRFLS